MKIAICDDDPNMITEIENKILEYFDEHKFDTPDITTYTSGTLLLDDKEQLSSLDMVFLDIQMPNITGINLNDAMKQYYSSDGPLLIDAKEKLLRISPHQIILIETRNRKVLIQTCKEEYTSLKPLSYWVQQTASLHSFYLTHKSYLINMEHISRIDNNRIYLYNNQFQASLTVRNRTAFKKAYL